MPYFSRDDIVQIGTPPGAAALGALRISGDNAFALAAAIAPDLHDCLRTVPPRSCRNCTLHLPLRPIGTPQRIRRDRQDAPPTLPCPARAFLMPAPASYTREHVVELHLPASPPSSAPRWQRSWTRAPAPPPQANSLSAPSGTADSLSARRKRWNR